MLKLEPKTFLGTRQQSWSSNDLYVGLSYYAAGCTFPKHQHSDSFFYFVLNGVCEERANGRCEVLRPGSLVYHPAGNGHSNYWPEQGRCLNVEFMTGFWEGARSAALSESTPPILGGRACDIARSIYDELLHIDSASEIVFEGLALVLLAEKFREASRENNIPRWLRRVQERLHEEYILVPSLGQMAADVGVHPAYLATSFQKHFGVSIGEFVRSRRMEKAREMLANSDRPLGEVALLLGFSDQSHFCRVFKKQTRFTPLEYRRLFAKIPDSVQES